MVAGRASGLGRAGMFSIATAIAALACVMASRAAVAQHAAPPTPATTPAPPADGRGVRAELFADTKFTKLVATRYDSEIDFVWGDGVAADGMPPNNFGVRWTGFLRAPAPGTYTIRTNADDVMRVWLDGKLILDGGGNREIIVQLGKQPHELKVEYVEARGWAAASLKWVVPGARPGCVIPPEALFHDRDAAARAKPGAKVAPPKGTGVTCEIFAGHKFAGRPVKRTERQIDWYGHGAAFAPDLPFDHFSVRYTTWLLAPRPGAYKLLVNSDDGHRLFLDGKRLAERWASGGYQSEVLVDLTDKPHALTLEYFEDTGPARVTLHWSQIGGFADQIIPPEAFFTDKAAAFTAAKKRAP